MTDHLSGGRPVLRRRNRRTFAIVAATAVAVLLICLLGIRFGIGGGGAVDAPTGLTTSASEDGVAAAWTGVDGADRYQLIRDDSTVVYEGEGTTYTDRESPAGVHRYSVRAMSGDVLSAPSPTSEVTVGSSWGRYAPFVAQFPKLLPQTPAVTGWHEIECSWLLSGFEAEMGQAQDGSGEILGKARIGCNGPDVAVSVGWLQSPSATDAIFAAASRRPGAEAIKWRYGTGYFDGGNHAMHLRPDNLENIWIGINANGATKDDLLAFANDMPLE